MNENLTFVFRHKAQTWMHEHQMRVTKFPDGDIWAEWKQTNSSYMSDIAHRGFCRVDSGEDRMDDFFFRNNDFPKSLRCIEKEDESVIFMDTVHMCPFCSFIDIDYEHNGDQMDKARKEYEGLFLKHRLDCNGNFNPSITECEYARYKLLALKMRNNPVFKLKMCDQCREWMDAKKHQPIMGWEQQPTSIQLQIHPKESWYNDKHSPYWRMVANSRLSDDKMKAIWETKKLCHGLSIKQSLVAKVKRSIKRRMRRKQLKPLEQQFFAMLLAGSNLTKYIKEKAT